MNSSGNPLVLIPLRLWLALLASLVLHLLLVASSAGWLPDWLPEEELLEVTLATLPPPPPPKAVPQAVPAPKSKPVAQPKVKPGVAAPANRQIPPPPAQTPVEQPVIQSTQLVAETVTHETAPQPQPEPETPVASESLPEIARPAPPKKIEMEFLVDYDGARAVEKQRYQMLEDGRYSLTSTVEAKGLLALALSDLNQKSEGRITPQGLKPDSFTYQYGNNAKKLQKASFDWAGKSLSMEVGDRKQVVPLEEGTQDLLSFLYQFMFMPPLEQFQLAVTTGKKIKTYHYFFEGEEEISTKLGTLRALHIAKSSGKGEEKAELWLAEDYHYLPVKIRKTDADGKVVQSIISNIKLDESP